MAKIKRFDIQSEKNRNRVRKHREKKKMQLEYEKKVQARVNELYPKSNFFSLDNVVTEDSENTQQPFADYDQTSEFVDKLKFWAVNHRISAKAINDLLSILIFVGFTSLPKDSRTFMRTPTNLPIKVLSNGKMWYNGLVKCIQKIFHGLNHSIGITLDFNFDGLPVFKSSNLQFWPILASIEGIILKLWPGAQPGGGRFRCPRFINNFRMRPRFLTKWWTII